jgi:hypothetical protein
MASQQRPTPEPEAVNGRAVDAKAEHAHVLRIIWIDDVALTSREDNHPLFVRMILDAAGTTKASMEIANPGFAGRRAKPNDQPLAVLGATEGSRPRGRRAGVLGASRSADVGHVVPLPAS